MSKPRVTLDGKHVARLREVQRLLAAYTHVTGRSGRSDLELLSMIEGQSDLAASVDDTFLALANDGYSLSLDRHSEEHYYQATADAVYDAIEERGLLFDPATSYAMHIGAVGGTLDSDDIEVLDAALRAAHGPKASVVQDGDNFAEWGEPLTTDPAYLASLVGPSAAATAAHVVLFLSTDTHPDAVIATVRETLPDVVWLTGEEIAATGNVTVPGDLDVSYALSEVEDWSKWLANPCQWCRRMVMDEAACGNDHTICIDCCDED